MLPALRAGSALMCEEFTCQDVPSGYLDVNHETFSNFKLSNIEERILDRLPSSIASPDAQCGEAYEAPSRTEGTVNHKKATESPRFSARASGHQIATQVLHSRVYM